MEQTIMEQMQARFDAMEAKYDALLDEVRELREKQKRYMLLFIGHQVDELQSIVESKFGKVA